MGVCEAESESEPEYESEYEYDVDWVIFNVQYNIVRKLQCRLSSHNEIARRGIHWR